MRFKTLARLMFLLFARTLLQSKMCARKVSDCRHRLHTTNGTHFSDQAAAAQTNAHKEYSGGRRKRDARRGARAAAQPTRRHRAAESSEDGQRVRSLRRRLALMQLALVAGRGGESGFSPRRAPIRAPPPLSTRSAPRRSPAPAPLWFLSIWSTTSRRPFAPPPHDRQSTPATSSSRSSISDIEAAAAAHTPLISHTPPSLPDRWASRFTSHRYSSLVRARNCRLQYKARRLSPIIEI